jgi:hypothetical protein
MLIETQEGMSQIKIAIENALVHDKELKYVEALHKAYC